MKYAHCGLWYLASPYSSPDKDVRDRRFRETAIVTGQLLKSGLLVFSPILHSVPVVEHGGGGTTWEDWREVDAEMIRRCQGMLVLTLSGWGESVGVSAEIKLARQRGMPVLLVDPISVDAVIRNIA